MSDERLNREAVEEEGVQTPEPAKAPARIRPSARPKPPKAPEVAPKDKVSRQVISSPSGICDIRVGPGALERLGKEVCSLVGKPRLAIYFNSDETSEDVAEEIRRQLADGGFRLIEHGVESGPSCRDLAHAATLAALLGDAGITADDIIVASGGVDALSLAVHVASAWCGGTPLVQVPTDALACVLAPTTPLGLTEGGIDEAWVSRGHARMAFVDPNRFEAFGTEESDMALAIAAASAIADNQNGCDRLKNRLEDIAAGSSEALLEQLVDCAKTRSRMANSSSVAVRQGLGYGRMTAAALAHLLDGADPSVLLAEAMRIEARLAYGIEAADADFVFEQDELLDALGLPVLACELDAAELAEAMRDECLRRSNRFLLPLPLGKGKIRLSSVPDEVLAEHLEAYCASRAELAD